MESINYAGGANMTLPADAQFVQGVSGNALYLPAGFGKVNIAGDRNELTISLWRQWDGVVEADDYRGVFATANIKVYFDQGTDLLTVELEDTKTVTDIKDDQEQTHWCFLFAKNSFFKIYKNAELRAELTAGNDPVDFSEGLRLGGGRTHATFDEVAIYAEVLEEDYIRGLYHLVSKGTVLGHVEHLIEQSVPLHTPHYLGTVKTPPEGGRVNIALGPKNGFNDATIGDWILIIEPLANYQKGWCYRWTGRVWEKLDPPANYTEEYSVCLKDQLEKCKDLFGDTNFFGSVFCQFLGFNKAVGESLAANTALLDNLTVKKLLVDHDINDPLDFELSINRDVGILAKNNGKTIFEILPTGKAFFCGDIITPPFKLIQGQSTPGSFEFNNEYLFKIIKNNVFSTSDNTLPFLGYMECQGTYKGKKIKGLSNYYEKANKIFHNIVYERHRATHGKSFYTKGDLKYNINKFSLSLFYEDGSTETIETLHIIHPHIWANGTRYDCSLEDLPDINIPYWENLIKIGHLKFSLNTSTTTMELTQLPQGYSDTYSYGRVYVEDGFLKIKQI
ncbi:LamG domain-containing protein [Treponema sp. OMZ 799]|uniref:LamG domain-containing protein n=1 Tax=Treponema sp. OMZ 799 TaxID=2563668 RepID=UPI0020A32F97|nr:LamG domain-containing protein [Treponema sp. OMZ 799]